MINYIVNYQNSYVFAHLFEFNVVELLQKEVRMNELFESAIFNHVFDFDEWPSTNKNTKKVLSPYNHSIFKLRHHYGDVFKSIHKEDLKDKKI